MAATTTTSSVSASTGRAPARKLDDLLALSAHELEELYRKAKTPAIEDLEGDLEGRMLVAPFGGEGLARVMRALARWHRFPWRGKSFTAHGEMRGEGINRVFTDRTRRFRFETSIGKSRAGDFDAVLLDYDVAENPRLVRRIQDEVRMVSPGLFLGIGWLRFGKGREKARPFAWFALAVKRP